MSPGWMMRSEKVCECGRPRWPDTELTHSTRSEPKPEQPVVGDGDQFVLAGAGTDGAGDVDVSGVDHRAGEFQKLDLVGGLDLAGVEHRLLAVDHLDAFLLQRAQHRQFHQVDADRFLVDAELHQHFLDLLGEVALDVQLQGKPALHGRDWRRDIIGDPRRGDALGRRRWVPKHRLADHGTQGIAHELVARPFADMGAGDVADVVEVEREHGAEAGVADRRLCAPDPLLVQASVVDPLLPVLGHGAPGGGRLLAVVFHLVSSLFSTAIGHGQNGRARQCGRPLAYATGGANGDFPARAKTARAWRKPTTLDRKRQ